MVILGIIMHKLKLILHDQLSSPISGNRRAWVICHKHIHVRGEGAIFDIF